MMTVDSGDQSRSSSVAGPTLTHLQRHGSTASETARSGYSSSLYSSGYSSGSCGGSAGPYNQHHIAAVMSGAATTIGAGDVDGFEPVSEEPAASTHVPETTHAAIHDDVGLADIPTSGRHTSEHSVRDSKLLDSGSMGNSKTRSTSDESSEAKSMGTDDALDKRRSQPEKSNNVLDSAATPVLEKAAATQSTARSSTPPATPPTQSEHRVKRIGRYLLPGKTLGKGNFARVEVAKHAHIQAKVAIKIIQTDRIKEDYVKRNLLRESAIMRQLNHPNIIRLYETMKTSTLYCIVTECAEGGELLQFVKNECPNRCMAEPLARHFIRQLISALFYMHEHGIVHRDLKMENILLDKEKHNIKIIDFGLSNCHEPGEFLATHCGSPEYAAPELFVPGQVYGQEVDVWSLGVNMFAMLAGKLPFRVPKQGANRRKRLLDQITAGIGQQQEEESAHFSASAMDLVRCLLQPDPSQRCNLRQAMLHPWITSDASQPLLPYQAPVENAASRDRIVDLMCARLDVQRTNVVRSIKENKCDWMAAIFHLLNDQPETQTVLRDMNRTDVTSSPHRRRAPPTSPPSTESQATPQTSITAVMRQLEVAAGKPLTQTKGVQRHQSLGTADKELQKKKPVDDSVNEKMPAQAPPRSGFRNRFSLARRSNRQKTSVPTNQKSSSVPTTPTVAAAYADDRFADRNDSGLVGSPIRSALNNRSMSQNSRSLSSGAVPLTSRHLQQQAFTDSSVAGGDQRRHSSSMSPVRAHQEAMQQDAGEQETSQNGGTFLRKRPASAGLQRLSDAKRAQQAAETKAASAASGDAAGAQDSHTLKKRRKGSLFGSLRGKDKLSKSASVDDIPHLKDTDTSKKGSKVTAATQLPAANTSSLSRSFALKPHAMSTDGAGTPVAQHRPHTLQPRSTSDYTERFGQAVPQYELSMPWMGPVFPGYASQGMDGSMGASPRRPSSRRQSSRNRGSSMGDALTGYTPAYLQASPFGGGNDYHDRSSYYGDLAQPANFSMLSGQPRSSQRRASSGSVSLASPAAAATSTTGSKNNALGLLRRSFRRRNSQA
eukprot:scpid9636/ scgid17904/ Hormonally up-regulated neu tumor-associated kinase; Serine/threonine-protein kinase MAK-V